MPGIIKKRPHITLLALTLAIGAGLRFYGLEIQSLWNDELASWNVSNFDNVTDVVNTGMKNIVHPPGYHILLYFVERYVGESEAALRFPSAVAGVFSILVIFLLGRRLYSEREGLLAAALMAVLWCPIYYSQEARPYSILLLTVLLAAYFWLDVVRSLEKGEKPPIHKTLAYLAAAITASYLHYFGLLFIGLQGVWAALVLLRKKRAWIYLFAIYGIVLLAYFPWIPVLRSQFGTEDNEYMRAPGPAFFLSYIGFLFNSTGTLVQLAVLALYGFFFWTEEKNFRKSGGLQTGPWLASPAGMLALWLAVPIILAYFISLTIKPVFTNRNLIISLPAAYLLLARALTQLPVRRELRIAAIFSVMGFFLYRLIFGMGYYTRPHKEQFREAVELVAAETGRYENSVVIGYTWGADYLNYYFKKKEGRSRVEVIAGQKEDTSLVSGYLQKEDPDYFWYVSAHRIPSPEFREFLLRNFTMVRHQRFTGAEVWLFRKKKAAEG